MNAFLFVWGHLPFTAAPNPDQEFGDGFGEESDPASWGSGWVPGLSWLLRLQSPLRHSLLTLSEDASGRRMILDRYLMDQTSLGEHAGVKTPSRESSGSLETGGERDGSLCRTCILAKRPCFHSMASAEAPSCNSSMASCSARHAGQHGCRVAVCREG